MRILRWSILLCAPGGVLWALTPLGIRLSEFKYKTPNVFWKLFPSAPLLLLIGVLGLYLWLSDRLGRLGKAGLLLAGLGLVLIIVGDVGQFWLKLDNVYIMSAPANRTFRIGLLVLAVGSIIFGAEGLRTRAIPLWAAVPFAVGSVGALVSFSEDLGTLGATLWVFYGACWALLGLAFLVEGVLSFLRGRRAASR